jgi:hypothetical protein
MIDSSITPEHGISRYAFDNTQGPACSIACAAGTVVRNYFVDVAALAHPSRGLAQRSDLLGQRAGRQINNLDGVEAALLTLMRRSEIKPAAHWHSRALQHAPWTLQNGYVVVPFPPDDLEAVNPLIFKHGEELIGALKIGIQVDTEVVAATDHQNTILQSSDKTTVTQAYCAAIPLPALAQGHDSDAIWSALGPLANLVLQVRHTAARHARHAIV